VQVKNIQLAKIVIPEVRVRARYDDDGQEQLRASLGALGQQEPILVVQAGEEFILVDGAHRLEEARLRGDATIPSVIRPGTMRDALLQNIAVSHNKGKTHPGDLLEVIKHLVEKEGMDSDDITRATGMSREQVERLWKISESSFALQSALMNGTVGLGIAFHIARLPAHAQQDAVLSEQLLYKRPVAEVKLLVDQTLDIMSTQRPVEAPPVFQPRPLPVCGGCHHQVHPAEIAMVPLCPSCHGHVYRLVDDAVGAPPRTA